jgi:hypothetical protein
MILERSNTDFITFLDFAALKYPRLCLYCLKLQYELILNSCFSSFLTKSTNYTIIVVILMFELQLKKLHNNIQTLSHKYIKSRYK